MSEYGRNPQAPKFLNELHPDEQHNAGGDCMNPRCDYVLTPQDWNDMKMTGGWFSCPKCGYTYNYLDPDYAGFGKPGGRTRAGLTMTEMGQIGENIIRQMPEIPTLGQVIEVYNEYHGPIDAMVGPYGCEIKTMHSEATPKFKIGGQAERAQKIQYCAEHGLKPGLIGVRLNFYTSKADIFARPAMTDTFIGSPLMPHVGTVDFTNQNPFPEPAEVPIPSQMPNDDDIPF